MSEILADSYPESNHTIAYTLGNPASNTGLAQSFRGNHGVLSSCVFYIQKIGAPTGNVVAKLYSHSGTFGSSSIPTGPALATSAPIDVTTLAGTYGLVTFQFGAGVTLSGQYYVIAIEYNGGGPSDYLNVGIDNTSPTHPGNVSFFIVGWGALANDIIFYVYTATTGSRALSPWLLRRRRAQQRKLERERLIRLRQIAANGRR